MRKLKNIIFHRIKKTKYYISDKGIVLSLYRTPRGKNKIYYKELRINQGKVCLSIEGIKKTYHIKTLIKEFIY